MNARAQRTAIRKEIAHEHRRVARAKLLELRAELKEARKRRAHALRETVCRCRHERASLRLRQKEERKRALERLRESLRYERLAARETCNARKQRVRETMTSAVEQGRAKLLAERSYAADLKRIEHANKHARKGLARAHERRTESDDEVRQNIAPDLVPLFERVKRGIKGSARESRTEAFLKYTAEHPGEVLEALDDGADRLVRELEQKHARLAKAVRRGKYTPEQLAETPF